ncbi:MAG TPA: class I SAM-dependent methyltransferase [Nocardioides sp.]|jgi:SAM-dependent methyltransferase
MTMTDRSEVLRQYATEDILEMRRSVWMPAADGTDPSTVALDAVRAAKPRNILEVGCGTGDFAARMQLACPEAELVATDQSERFVELTASRGLNARWADVQELPFAANSFDVVAAMWMLYHVPNLDRALAEVRRVLRPGGLFVAVTNGNEHTADLRRDAGGDPLITTFSSENGEESLSLHFDEVRRHDISTRAVFADRSTALAYLNSLGGDFGWDLPEFDGAREYAGFTTVFLASPAPVPSQRAELGH